MISKGKQSNEEATFKRYIGWGIEANIQCLKEKRGEK